MFLLIPLSGLVFYETGLTEQFEIELSRLLEMDIHDLKNGTVQEQINTINVLEQNMQQQQIILIVIASIGLISGISLLKHKEYILKS